MGQEREAAFRIRKAAKRLLFEAAEEYLREHGAEALFKMKSQSQQVEYPYKNSKHARTCVVAQLVCPSLATVILKGSHIQSKSPQICKHDQ